MFRHLIFRTRHIITITTLQKSSICPQQTCIIIVRSLQNTSLRYSHVLLLLLYSLKVLKLSNYPYPSNYVYMHFIFNGSHSQYGCCHSDFETLKLKRFYTNGCLFYNSTEQTGYYTNCAVRSCNLFKSFNLINYFIPRIFILYIDKTVDESVKKKINIISIITCSLL